VHFLLMISARLGAFLVGMLVCELVSIAVLRCFRFNFPLSFAFHILSRRENEIVAALKGRSMGTYIFVSGFLLLAFPLFAGMILFDYLGGVLNVNSFIGCATIFFVLPFYAGARNWKKAETDGVSPGDNCSVRQ
jgi:hypothetical protein